MKIVRSVDVGYGNVKYVASRSEQEIHCKMFPSLAPMASSLKLSTGMSEARDTVLIPCDGVTYEVGPDSRLGLKKHHSRILHDDYMRTGEYMALLRVALSYMKVPVLDLLVVGLPVQLMTTHSLQLAQKLQGIHPIDAGRTVEVKHVWALAQPLGGLLDYAMGPGLYETAADQVNLIIDCGYYTVDWLTSMGLKVMPERTGSIPGGTHVILEALARSVSESLGVPYTDMEVLERALIKGQLQVGGTKMDLKRYWPKVQVRLDEAANAISSSVGDALDVANIILVGGGARFYEASIHQRFPAPNLIVAPDPVFANLRGFQRAGERHSSVGT
ncbi:MAG: PRTRC system protein D [Acidiferrobacter sp.]